MHLRIAGSGGVALVLLHMSPLSAQMFDRIVPLLARERLVVCPDRLGFGCSDRLPGPLPFPEYAAATLDALDAAGIGRFDTCGIHTGSCEAIELAAEHGDRVRRAVVVALVVLRDDEEREAFRRSIVPPAPEPGGSHLDWYWRYWLRVQHLCGPEPDLAVVQARALAHMEAWPDSVWTYNSVFDYDTAARLPRVACPLLVLAPRDEFWEHSHEARPLLPPQARFVPLSDVGYEAFETAPERLAQLIADFLA
jgi:pimeloyl-ACP methyl ester carboxylesterase